MIYTNRISKLIQFVQEDAWYSKIGKYPQVNRNTHFINK